MRVDRRENQSRCPHCGSAQWTTIERVHRHFSFELFRANNTEIGVWSFVIFLGIAIGSGVILNWLFSISLFQGTAPCLAFPSAAVAILIAARIWATDVEHEDIRVCSACKRKWPASAHTPSNHAPAVIQSASTTGTHAAVDPAESVSIVSGGDWSVMPVRIAHPSDADYYRAKRVRITADPGATRVRLMPGSDWSATPIIVVNPERLP